MKEKAAGQSPAYLLSEKENSPPVVLLSAGQLVPFPGHPFRVEEDGELEQLTLLYQQDNTPEVQQELLNTLLAVQTAVTRPAKEE
jgi:hypothetical protein